MNSIRLVSRQVTRSHLSLSRQASTVAASSASPVSLSNIEAAWKGLTPAEQEATFKHLEELQKKDWKELSIDEKKASYYVAFGPHGPREPILAPGSGAKTFGGLVAGMVAAGVLFYGIRSFGSEAPRTITKEWEEASNERAKEANMDPITGISSEGYKGKGFVH